MGSEEKQAGQYFSFKTGVQQGLHGFIKNKRYQ
jgi:hypothetical protein